MLSHHLLPFLHTYRLDEIDYAVLSAYVAHKLERNEEIAVGREAGVTLRDGAGRPRRPLSPRTINMTLDLIARIFKDAVKRGMMQGNPASDRDLRLKVTQRKGNFLEADELLALIEAGTGIDRADLQGDARARGGGATNAAGQQDVEGDRRRDRGRAEHGDMAREPPQGGRNASVRRAILATLGCAGLRNGEVCDLDLSDLDFAHGVIHVRDAKTEAGIRQVNMTPWLHDELLAYRASRPERAARGARVPDADRRTPRPAQHQPQRDLPGDPSGECPPRWAQGTANARVDHRAHLPQDVHHPDARSRRTSSVRSGPGRATRTRRPRWRSTRRCSSAVTAGATARRSTL